MQSLKVIIALLACLGLRFVPFRPPNVEPVLAFTLPVGGVSSVWGTGLFSAANIVLFDILSGSVGSWTAIAAVSYGMVGVAAAFYARAKRSLLSQVGFTVVATLAYDFVTGVVASSLLFKMSFAESFRGQIPFTMNHLVGSIFLVLAVVPLLSAWLAYDGLFGLQMPKRRLKTA